jgi:TPP-dependent 2-oxoacid decarboxylase
MIVIVDPGDVLFGSSDLFISEGAHFLAPTYYASLGFALPAALGVKAAASQLRPLVLVATVRLECLEWELAIIARFGMHPIAIVLVSRQRTRVEN